MYRAEPVGDAPVETVAASGAWVDERTYLVKFGGTRPRSDGR
jgi:hypothetical protein